MTELLEKLDNETSKLDLQIKICIEQEQYVKMRESQLTDLSLKTEVEYLQVQELRTAKVNDLAIGAELSKKIDEFTQQCLTASQLKQQYVQQSIELQRMAAEEKREKQSLNLLCKNLQHELKQNKLVFGKKKRKADL